MRDLLRVEVGEQGDEIKLLHEYIQHYNLVFVFPSAFGLDLSEDPDPRPKAKDLNIIKNENLLLNCARNSARCRLRSATFRAG